MTIDGVQERNCVFKLPFGEEIGSGSVLRTAGQGYGAGDTNRWKYGMLQRDAATGLDHTGWRKYENLSGRWTSPDPSNGSMSTLDPQSFNKFVYAQSDPVNFVDPSGLDRWDANPGFIPVWMNGWNRTNPLNITERFINYSQESVTATHDRVANTREYPWIFGGFAAFHFGQDRSQNPDYALSVYEGKLGKRLTQCINSVFGKYSKNLSAGRQGIGSNYLEYQQQKNAPLVKLADLGPNRLGVSDYYDVDSRSVTLSSNNIVNKVDKATGAVVSAFEVGQRAYVHELGNYLSRSISLGRAPSTFGDPNGIMGRNGTGPDFDTGAALEKCVFGNVFP